MNRLGTRLMASYLAVLLVTLLVISIMGTLALLARPAPAEPTWRELSLISGALGRLWNTGLGSNVRQERLLTALQEVADNQGVRVLLADPSGQAMFDSLGVIAAGQRIDLHLQPGLPEGAPRNDRLNPPPQQQWGSFTLGGQEWLLVAQDAPQQFGNNTILALARPRPGSTWSGVTEFFSDWLLGPLLLAVIVGLVSAFGLAWLVSRGITRSLQRLGEAAQAITAGDQRARAAIQGPDEVRDVARAFNRMVEQVQVTQQAQQDFLANVSHDLRTPLTSIQGFSQAIVDGASHDPAHHARIIHEEAGRLNRMVGELLDLARISTGRLSMRQSSIDLTALAAHITEVLAIKASDKGIHLVRDLQPVPAIGGDGDRLAQVITNLVENAIKYTPQGGTVRVGLQPANEGALLDISDTGLGIPQADLPRVFERFYQVDKSRGPSRGSGLGLAITAEIVQAHGGRIRADSGGEGRGTTFSVWFPGLEMSTVIRRKIS